MTGCKRADHIQCTDAAVNEWLHDAEEEIETARCLLQHDRYQHALVHSQQAVEKALKAMHLKRFGKKDRTHDLVLMAREIALPAKYMDGCMALTMVYVTRYVDAPPIENPCEMAEELMPLAEEIVEWIRTRL
ncbi:MAG: hypothetical protein CVT48_06605 [Thermoplasmata archaeon HGW-Thermoplasmata-1]|nr:MAG: hypothetical protein CVT48_06605 [Thermoplasmata archaeon HGW-Thermoplasmata-1]